MRPCFQLLVYPGVDMTLEHASIATMSSGFFLERASIDWFLERYLPPGHSRKDPRASPFHAGSLAGLPPAFIATAGFDPAARRRGRGLRREARRRGQRRQSFRCYGGLVHGFLHSPGPSPRRASAFADLAGALAGTPSARCP